MACKISQLLTVTRQASEVISPARPTPREVKQLSDIDDQESLRFQVPVIFSYKNDPSPLVKGKDPVKVIKEATRKALVFYYPFAGRLREGPNRKLMVDCNEQGVIFTEADANFKFEQVGNAIPPYLDQLLYNVPGSEGILDSPLLLIQVTRLTCGGFILAIRFNHTICDALGFVQFLKTMEEMARGADSPSLLPVWQRELLNARDPPKITCIHHEYGQLNNNPKAFISTNPKDMDHKSFYFGPKDIQALRNQLPLHLKKCSTFDLLAALMWRCRTIALKLDLDEIVQFSCVVNVRGIGYNMHLPSGYYGNAFAFPAIYTKAEFLCKSPLEYAVELVKAAKAKMNEEYIRSAADLMAVKGRRAKYPTQGNFMVTDLTKVGFVEVDFGWGKPVFGGTPSAMSVISYFLKYKREDGEIGILVPILLPMSSMEKFEEEIQRMIQGSVEGLYNMNVAEKFSKL